MSPSPTILALVSLALAGAASAQGLEPRAPYQPPPVDSVLSGVEVSVPKIIERTRYGVVSSAITMSVRVSYRDLDMHTPAGVAELDKRVGQAANYLCDQLERMYPDGSPVHRECAREAVHGAQPQVILARQPG